MGTQLICFFCVRVCLGALRTEQKKSLDTYTHTGRDKLARFPAVQNGLDAVDRSVRLNDRRVVTM